MKLFYSKGIDKNYNKIEIIGNVIFYYYLDRLMRIEFIK